MLVETVQLHKMDLVGEDQRDAVFKKQVTDRNAKASALDRGRE